MKLPKLPRMTTFRITVAIGMGTIALFQAGSWAYQRYLRCQIKANELAQTEDVFRRKGNVSEELSPRLREVAALAREVAKSASSDFERKRWLEMARTEEEKAVGLEHEAVRMMARADEYASRAAYYSRLAWRPWMDAPD